MCNDEGKDKSYDSYFDQYLSNQAVPRGPTCLGAGNTLYEYACTPTFVEIEDREQRFYQMVAPDYNARHLFRDQEHEPGGMDYSFMRPATTVDRQPGDTKTTTRVAPKRR